MQWSWLPCRQSHKPTYWYLIPIIQWHSAYVSGCQDDFIICLRADELISILAMFLLFFFLHTSFIHGFYLLWLCISHILWTIQPWEVTVSVMILCCSIPNYFVRFLCGSCWIVEQANLWICRLSDSNFFHYSGLWCWGFFYLECLPKTLMSIVEITSGSGSLYLVHAYSKINVFWSGSRSARVCLESARANASVQEWI